MIESDEHGRLDLRPLTPSEAQIDRAIASTMARVRDTPQLPPDTVIEFARRLMRPAIISAAVLAAAAAYTIVMIDPRESSESRGIDLADWVESQHVPTNSELLLAFHGYGR